MNIYALERRVTLIEGDWYLSLDRRADPSAIRSRHETSACA